MGSPKASTPRPGLLLPVFLRDGGRADLVQGLLELGLFGHEHIRNVCLEAVRVVMPLVKPARLQTLQSSNPFLPSRTMRPIYECRHTHPCLAGAPKAKVKLLFRINCNNSCHIDVLKSLPSFLLAGRPLSGALSVRSCPLFCGRLFWHCRFQGAP